MAWVAVGIGGAGALMGGIQAFSGAKQKKKIAQEIANQKEVPLTNIADGMTVSTRGADLKKEGAMRLAATQTAALAEGGSRNLIAGIGSVDNNLKNTDAEIATNLDEQQNNITNVRAQDEGRIQSAKEQRQQAKLAALSGQYAAAQDTQAQGMGNMMQGVGMAAKYGKKDTPKDTSTTTTTGSDRRLKNNISKIGESPSGLNIYSFEYNDKKFGEGIWQGVMSDEITKDAVVVGDDGYDRVDYSMLDVEFKQL